ncbi:MAG: TPM domain-containing protein [Bacteroidales bacterium]
MPSAKKFFSPQEKEDIVLAIKSAELDTSGEIRVHIENRCPGDPRERAALLFRFLKMDRTRQRNGVLFYLAVKNRKFAIIGDEGINRVVPDGFWDEVRDVMLEHFREGRFAQGLVEGIQLAGKQLKEHFPYQTDDVNELSDDISFGNQ